MTTNATNDRIIALEQRLKSLCTHCRDWPPAVTLWNDDAGPDYPGRCPVCGRRGPLVMRFVLAERAGGPQ